MSQYSNHLFTPGTQNNSWSHLYEYINDGARVLDVGCSSGNFGETLIKLKNCEVIGIDLDKKDIDLAKKRLSSAHVMDINDLESVAKLGKFDFIIFADVIEHLVNPSQTLSNMKLTLRKGGSILYSIPHMGHISVRLELLSGRFEYKDKGLLDKTHLHFYDLNEVQMVFNDAGYSLAKMNPVISMYPNDVLRKKLKKVGLSITDEFVENIRETKGDIFQFVGQAVPVTKKKIVNKKSPKYVMPQDEVMEFAENILKENKRIWNESQEIIRRNILLEKQLKDATKWKRLLAILLSRLRFNKSTLKKSKDNQK